MRLVARDDDVVDGEYRGRFLDPLIDDLKLTLLARDRYRAGTLPQ